MTDSSNATASSEPAGAVAGELTTKKSPDRAPGILLWVAALPRGGWLLVTAYLLRNFTDDPAFILEMSIPLGIAVFEIAVLIVLGFVAVRRPLVATAAGATTVVVGAASTFLLINVVPRATVWTLGLVALALAVGVSAQKRRNAGSG